jgi:hypothetical protein
MFTDGRKVPDEANFVQHSEGVPIDWMHQVTTEKNKGWLVS